MPFYTYRRLLERAATLLPAGVEVVLLGDRGFSNHALIEWVTTKPAWPCHLRLKGSCWFCHRGQWRQLKQVHLAAGQAVFLHSVTLFKRPKRSGVHLAIARDPVSGNLGAVVSSRSPQLQTLWD